MHACNIGGRLGRSYDYLERQAAQRAAREAEMRAKEEEFKKSTEVRV